MVNAFTCSFNVLNYFTTLGSRGAETEEERENQLTKIVAGALALNADAIAIIEVCTIIQGCSCASVVNRT